MGGEWLPIHVGYLNKTGVDDFEREKCNILFKK